LGQYNPIFNTTDPQVDPKILSVEEPGERYSISTNKSKVFGK